MKYVYILQSLQQSEHFYTGITDDLQTRLSTHNSGSVTHTAKYRPWSIKSYVAFTDETRAFAFEKYLTSGSGEPSRKNIFDGSRVGPPLNHRRNVQLGIF